MFNRDHFERLVYCPICVETDLVHQAVQALAAENPLDLREHGLNGIELWAVPYVQHRCDVELHPPALELLRLVHGQLVHEQREGR